MKKVSVIVPVYNGADFLEKSIGSILQQTYQELEVIAVDDGSGDNSYAVLQKMAEEDDRLKVIHQENKGIAKTRNCAMTYASGQYIMFMDQDDRMEQELAEKLVKAAEEFDSDIVVSGYCRTDYSGKVLRRVELDSSEKWPKYMIEAPWGKLYRKSFLEKEKLGFLDVVKGEDCYFTLLAYSSTDKITTIPYVGYHWMYNSESVSNTIHATLKEEATVLWALDAIVRNLDGCRFVEKEMVDYYFVKAIVYELLYSIKGAGWNEICTFHKKLFLWLENQVPEFKGWKYFCFSPKGEKWIVSGIIKSVVLLDKIKLLNPLLKIYSLV